MFLVFKRMKEASLIHFFMLTAARVYSIVGDSQNIFVFFFYYFKYIYMYTEAGPK